MKPFFIFLSLLCLLSTSAFATYVAVLETAADGSAKDSVSLLDRQYLTNVLREQAVKELTAEENYTIMTRENINAMLPPGKAIEDCEGSCLAETGRNIAADYICQARVGFFGKSLTLSAELYETAGNKLVASFNGRGNDVEELLKIIEERSPAFFHRIKELASLAAKLTTSSVDSGFVKGVEPVETFNLLDVNTERTSSSSTLNNVPDTSSSTLIEEPSASVIPGLSGNSPADSSGKVGESIPANVDSGVAETSAKKSGIRWVPLSISVAATVAGAVLTVVGNSKAKAASEKNYSTESEYKKYHDDAKSGQTLRGVGIGLAIAGAVGIGLSIAF